MPNPLRVIHYLVYLTYRAGTAAICLLPIEWGFRIGRAVGGLGWWLLPAMRRLSEANLRIAFAGEKTDAEIGAMAREHFRRLGANLVSAVKLASLDEEEIMARVVCEIPPDVEHLRRTRKGGWLAMISHIGNWEVFAHLGAIIPEFEIGAIYQPLGNPYIDAHFRSARERFGLRLFNRRRDLMHANRFLRSGGVLGVLVDQHAGDAGIWAPLFGRLASTSPLAASLATRADAPILPIACLTTGVARWRVEVSMPLPVRDDNPALLTAEINQALEAQIRRSPEDWLWAHNRWKTPAPNFLLSHYHRGVVYPAGFDKKLKPFRILVVSPEHERDAIAGIKAVHAIKNGRPDVELIVLAENAFAAFWRGQTCVDRVVAIEEDIQFFNLVRAIADLGRVDAAFMFSTSRTKARALLRAGVPRRVGYSALKPFVNQPCIARTTDPGAEAFYLKLAVHAGANPDRAPTPAPALRSA
jgi:lauroyl/myristoyl acyltransferase